MYLYAHISYKFKIFAFHTNMHIHITPHLCMMICKTPPRRNQYEKEKQSGRLARRIWSWGSMALVLQLFNVYLTTAFLKSRGQSWSAGTAVHQ